MTNQILKQKIPNEVLFEFLEKICMKSGSCYTFDLNAHKKMLFYEYYDAFQDAIREHYHISKQYYITRKPTYNSITNIIKQICKFNGISYTNEIKYNESVYTIVYYIYRE